MRRTRVVEVVVLVLLAAPVCVACLWDEDTLAAEARGRPGVAEVLIGWIDRWPDRVYEERLARRSREHAVDPTDLALYDDAGVACDRLGRYDEAIEWMARKRTALDALETKDDEHEYRYHANLGTFHMHRWIAGGADRSDIGDVERAREHIARAIHINPDAHFGREMVQLRLIELLLGHTQTTTSSALAPLYADEEEGVRYGRILEGLVGLVELGDAWESLDVFSLIAGHTLSRALLDGNLGALAEFRAQELRDAGHTSLLNAALADDGGGEYALVRAHEPAHYVYDLELEKVRDWYGAARRAADERNASREAYIRRMLDAGVHPDDVGWDVFFTQWTEPELPAMPDTLGQMTRDEQVRLAYSAIVGVLCAVAIAGGLVVRWRVMKRRSLASAENS